MSRRSRSPFIAGMIAGSVAGAAWVLAERLVRDRTDELFDWDQVRAIALRVGAQGPGLDPAPRDELKATYKKLLRDIAEPLAVYTGAARDWSSTAVEVLDRGEWIAANIANVRRLLAPLETLALQRGGAAALAPPMAMVLGRLTLSAELGLLLGYLARHVLGQYDFTLFAGGPAEPGKLYFVEPNVHAAQLRLGLPAREFRLWLTLHEATHAYEFEEHPWVGEYFTSNLAGYLEAMTDQLTDGYGGLPLEIGAVLRRLRAGESVLEAVMTAPQRELFARLQALMTVLEGYATHVMNAVGAKVLVYHREIEQRVEDQWRRRSRAEVLFLRLSGLQLKLEQYRLGTAFVEQVEGARGTAFVNQVWDGPDNLPTLEEIREPARWIQRIERAAA